MTENTKIIGPCRAVLLALVLGMPVQALAEDAAEPVPGRDPDQSLSEQLDEDKGVITPPPVGDEEIHVPAPNPNPGTTPVIPPPGTAGGDPTIQPQ